MSELTKNFDASLLDKLENVVVYGYIAEEHFKSLLSSVVGEKTISKEASNFRTSSTNRELIFLFPPEHSHQHKPDTFPVVDCKPHSVAYSVAI